MEESSSIRSGATAEAVAASSVKTLASSATSSAAASQPVLSDGSDSGSGGKASKGLKLEIKQKPNAASAFAPSHVTTPPYDIAGKNWIRIFWRLTSHIL